MNRSPCLLLLAGGGDAVGQRRADLGQRNPAEVHEPRGEVVAIPEEDVVLAEVVSNQKAALHRIAQSHHAQAPFKELDVLQILGGANLEEKLPMLSQDSAGPPVLPDLRST